jgi:hypothetical protein
MTSVTVQADFHWYLHEENVPDVDVGYLLMAPFASFNGHRQLWSF